MKTLLLADDSVTIQRVIELTFADEDVRVVSVDDGRRALQWMENERPDIVLVDVDVPEVSGYDVASHVKDTPSLMHVPVLLLAGAFEPVDQERVRSSRCDGVLLKPFGPKQLVSRVLSLLAHSGADRPASATHGDAETVRRSGGNIASVRPFPAPRPPLPAIADTPAADAAVQTPGRQAPDLEHAPVAAMFRAGDRERAAPARVSLAEAFSALLSAEQSSEQARPPASLPDEVVDEAVRRALVRMTDDTVRRLVIETAERLIREEIEKIKQNPE